MISPILWIIFQHYVRVNFSPPILFIEKLQGASKFIVIKSNHTLVTKRQKKYRVKVLFFPHWDVMQL